MPADRPSIPELQDLPLTLSDQVTELLRGRPPAIGVDQVAELLGVSRWAVYDAAKTGAMPVQPFRVGRSLRWPTAPLLRALGLDPSDVTLPAA